MENLWSKKVNESHLLALLSTFGERKFEDYSSIVSEGWTKKKKKKNPDEHLKFLNAKVNLQPILLKQANVAPINAAYFSYPKNSVLVFSADD